MITQAAPALQDRGSPARIEDTPRSLPPSAPDPTPADSNSTDGAESDRPGSFAAAARSTALHMLLQFPQPSLPAWDESDL
eukprot:109721-Heterocapsa_arctica.AAC.1